MRKGRLQQEREQWFSTLERVYVCDSILVVFWRTVIPGSRADGLIATPQAFPKNSAISQTVPHIALYNVSELQISIFHVKIKSKPNSNLVVNSKYHTGVQVSKAKKKNKK